MLMMSFLLSVLALLSFSKNLLLSLLLLEITSFVVLGQVALVVPFYHSSDVILISLFSVFVMEGVIALSGLISLVSFTGSDSIGSSSLLKL